jgi:hypothetical protein
MRLFSSHPTFKSLLQNFTSNWFGVSMGLGERLQIPEGARLVHLRGYGWVTLFRKILFFYDVKIPSKGIVAR